MSGLVSMRKWIRPLPPQKLAQRPPPILTLEDQQSLGAHYCLYPVIVRMIQLLRWLGSQPKPLRRQPHPTPVEVVGRDHPRHPVPNPAEAVRAQIDAETVPRLQPDTRGGALREDDFRVGVHLEEVGETGAAGNFKGGIAAVEETGEFAAAESSVFCVDNVGA